jgi:hypothetical protein
MMICAMSIGPISGKRSCPLPWYFKSDIVIVIVVRSGSVKGTMVKNRENRLSTP